MSIAISLLLQSRRRMPTVSTDRGAAAPGRHLTLSWQTQRLDPPTPSDDEAATVELLRELRLPHMRAAAPLDQPDRR